MGKVEHQHIPSEVYKIIEGGLENDTVKVRAYANLLASKCGVGPKRIIERYLSGEYKNDPKIRAWNKK
jgi:hypothetical protein